MLLRFDDFEDEIAIPEIAMLKIKSRCRQWMTISVINNLEMLFNLS